MKYFLIAFTFLFLSSPAFADIKLADVHSMETSAGMKNGVLLMSIENTGAKTDKLIDVETPVATVAEIHQMAEEKGIMKMREVGAVTIESGKKVTLGPNGYHIMLMGLKQPLVVGKAFPATLKFERGGEILTTVRVQSNKPMPHEGMDMTPMDMHHMDMKH